MAVMLRRATLADAEAAASLLTELGYPSKKDDARDRLMRSLHSATSCVLVAELASEVIGLLNAELIPHFPNGTTICRVTALVVASHHRGHGIGERLIARATDFAREHRCSGLEVTSSERRVDFASLLSTTWICKELVPILPGALNHAPGDVRCRLLPAEHPVRKLTIPSLLVRKLRMQAGRSRQR